MFWRCVQMLGVMSVASGVVLEVYTRQDWYFVLITAGSMVFALGTKFVYYSKKHKSGKVSRETHDVKGDLHVG